jgi:hypothetical protein
MTSATGARPKADTTAARISALAAAIFVLGPAIREFLRLRSLETVTTTH